MNISQIQSLFDTAKTTQPWAKDLTFEQFAGYGAQATGDPEMARVAQAGPIENTIRGWNQGLTDWVNSGPVDEYLGEKTGDLAEMFGVNRQTGIDVGSSLPRQVVNMLPMLIPGGAPVRVAGMVGSGLLSGVDTYDQTGSGWQSVLAASAPPVVSKAMQVGGNAALQTAAKYPFFNKLGVTGSTQLPARLVNQGTRGQIVPMGSRIQDTIIQGGANKAVNYLGGQVAGQGTALGLDILGQGWEGVANKDYLFANMVGNLAFAPLDVGDFLGTRVISSRDIAPDKPLAQRTPAEQRAFDFEKLVSSLNIPEQAQFKKAAGLDIAQQLIHEGRIKHIEETYNSRRTEGLNNLSADWTALQQSNPNLPDLKTAISNPASVPFETFAEANTRLEEYKMLVSKLNGEEKAKWSQAFMKPNLETLQAIAIDELNLPETLLSKPVKERSLKDYQDVLADKISDRGVKALYAMHKVAAGEPVELQVRGVAEELGKLLRGEPTKFAEDRAFVAMAMWATGKKPRSEKVVMEKVKGRVKEGETTKKAVAKEVKKDVQKLVKRVRGKDKKQRKVNEEVTIRAEEMQELINQAGAAVDAGKATPEQKFLIDAYKYASEASGGDDKVLRKMLGFLGKVAVSGKSLEEKLKAFKAGVQTTKDRAALAKSRDEVTSEQPLDENVATIKSSLAEKDDSEDIPLTFDGEDIVQAENATPDEDGEVVVEDMLEDMDVNDKPVSTKELTDQAIEKEALRIVMENTGYGPKQAQEFLNTLDSKKTKTLLDVAKNNLMSYAKNNSVSGVPQFGLQNVMSFDKWADTLLADQGFDSSEIPALKEHFARVVEMFYSPEVKYGFLDEFPMESKLAKGYVGVVGENGVRWQYGDLNNITHGDQAHTAPRLGETKFRYREDTGTLYRWSTITDEEMASLVAKLEKAGKEVRAVKLITPQNIADAHGISTLFGPEPGQKMKWARAAAGGGFDFALGEVQGGKLLRPGKGAVTLAKDGTLTVQELKVAGGQFGPLQDGEVSFYKELVPEAFNGDRVNVKMLWEKLNTLGEQVKVVTYGQDGKVSATKKEQDQLIGELDILGVHPAGGNQFAFNSRIISSDSPNMPEAAKPKVARLLELMKKTMVEDRGPKATSYYDQISPFDTKKFPVTRVDVVLPPTSSPEYLAQQKKLGLPQEGKLLWQPDNLHENLPNTLGWAMVQIVPHPVTGEKVMFVGEVQSRWGQTIREKSKDAARVRKQAAEFDEDPSLNRQATLMERDVKDMDHPLLPIHQNLILKAVIKEAQKQGISKVAVSDGETAMMTEGHDKFASDLPNEGDWVAVDLGQPSSELEPLQMVKDPSWKYDGPGGLERAKQILDEDYKHQHGHKGFKIIQVTKELLDQAKIPDQNKGMRLAYDTTMPSIMKKLVGEGEMQNFGEHKNAVTASNDDDAFAPIGSPVFLNQDNTPKTNATARVYDITNPSERLNTLFARKGIPGSTIYAGAIERLRQIFLNPAVSKNLTPTQKLNQTTSLLAHENSHILLDKARKNEFGPEAKTIVDNMDLWVSNADPQDIDTVVDVMADVYLSEQTRKLPGVEDVIKNLRDNAGKMDKDEVLANMYGIWATGLHQVKDPGKFYTMLPKVVRDAFDWLGEKLQGVTNAVKMYVKFGGDASKLAQVQNVKDVFAAVRKGARTAEENLGELAKLANLSQADAVDMHEMLFAQGRYGGTGKTKDQVENFLDNWIMRMSSLAQTYPGLEEPFNALKDTTPLTTDLTAQAFAGLGWGDYSYTGLDVKKDTGPSRIRDSDGLRKLASKVNVELQQQADSAIVKNPDGTITFNKEKLSPEVRTQMNQFSPEAQSVLAQYFIKRSTAAMPIVHGTIVKNQWDIAESNVHQALLAYESTKNDYKGSKQIAKELMQALRQEDAVKVGEVLKRIPDPMDAQQVLKFAEIMAQNTRELQADYAANPAFGSLKRFQPIKQKWTKGGDVKNLQANTAKEAEQKAAELEALGYTPGIPRITDFKPTDEWVLESASKKRLRDQEARLKAAIDELGVDPAVKEELKKNTDFVGMLEADEAGRNVFSTSVKRKFAPGVEELDVLEQDLNFMQKAIAGSQRAALDAKVRVAMLNPELDNHYDAKQTFLQGYENFKTPNHPFLSKLSKANAAWFLGFNLPSHIAELMQPVMTHFAEMRNLGLRAGESLKILMGAEKDIAGFYKRNFKKFAKGEPVHLWDDWANKDERDMLFDLKHVINSNPLNYAFDEIGFKQQQLVELTEGGKKKSLAELAMSPAVAYGNMGLKLYNLFTRHNAVMGLVGGYRALRKAGWNHEQAKDKVRLYETVVNKSGGRADRQAAPFKGNALLGHLFYGLQGYTTGWFSQLATYARHGYMSKDYAGFKDNPQAVKNARNALWTMLGTQLGAAGLMGMPFMSALMSLYEDMTDEDLRGKLYEGLTEATGDPLLAQAASHGVASAVAEKLGMPADLHGRFAIGGFLGFNAYDGFSSSSLLGPTAGMINSLWNMGSKFSQEHDVRAALDAGGPTGIRNLAKGLDSELPETGESRFSTALGFRSPEARKEIEFERIAQKRNEKAAREVAHAARRVQESLPRGGQVVQQVLVEEARKLLKGEGGAKEVKDMIGKIATKVKTFEEQRVLPPDLREVGMNGNQEELGALARAMGVRLPPSQEMEREQLKQGVYQMMGLPYRSSMKRALAQDLAVEADPFAIF